MPDASAQSGGEVIVAVAVLFDDVIQILVAASAAGGELILVSCNYLIFFYIYAHLGCFSIEKTNQILTCKDNNNSSHVMLFLHFFFFFFFFRYF